MFLKIKPRRLPTQPNERMAFARTHAGRVWTPRHYIPCLAGSLGAAIYANMIYHGIAPMVARIGIVIEPWMIAVTAQVVMWLCIWAARRAWFD
jgi:hypothetical protein